MDKGKEYEKAKAHSMRHAEPRPVYANLKEAKEGMRVETLTRQIAKHGHQRQLSEALSVYEELLGEGLKPTRYTYSGLVNAYVSSGDVHGAVKVKAEKLSSCSHSVMDLLTFEPRLNLV